MKLPYYSMNWFKIFHLKKKPILDSLASTQLLNPPASESKKLNIIDFDLKHSTTKMLDCLKETDSKENVYKTICGYIVKTLISDDFKIYNLSKKKHHVADYFKKERLIDLIKQVFIQYLKETLLKQDFDALINSFNYKEYLYENYLEFCNSFDTQTVLLLARKKEYTDHKSFYRDFLPHFETVYRSKSPMVRRKNGLYLFDIEKLSPNESKKLTERNLESMVNKNESPNSFEAFFQRITSFFSRNSKEEFGLKIMTFLIMQLFIKVYLINNQILNENTKQIKGNDLYESYKEFLTIFQHELVNIKKHMPWLYISHPPFEGGKNL